MSKYFRYTWKLFKIPPFPFLRSSCKISEAYDNLFRDKSSERKKEREIMPRNGHIVGFTVHPLRLDL